MSATTNAGNSSGQAQSPPNPLAMLDFGIPGVAHASMPQLLGWAINSYAPLMLFLGAFAAARSYVYQFLALLENYFTTELHVKPSDPSHDMLMAWIFSQGLSKSARARIARVSDRGPNLESHCDGEEKPIWFAPCTGSFFFWFRGTLLSYRSYTTTTPFREEEHIIIKCAGRTGKILETLIQECQQEYLRQNQNTTAIFEHRGEFWKKTATKDPRPLSSVIIPEPLKEQLVDDLKRFRDAGNRARYRGHFIPYRRGYLLYGPPGTGKSSLTSAIAGQCKLDIYIVDIPSVNNEQLKGLFNRLPEKCIVLLEDIDAVGADRDEDEEEHRGRRHSLSLSGLLNTLDGVASQEGRILIMTTNHIQQLDRALIRPGRIDLKLELNYADSELTASLFEFMYKPIGETISLTKAETMQIGRVAREFAAITPEHKFSVAQIMSYIQQNWDSPTTALENSREWVEQALQEREDHCREDSSGLLIGPVTSATRPVAAEGELEWLWTRSDAKVRNDIPRTQSCRNLPAAACITPPSSPCEIDCHHATSEEISSYMGSGSPHLPAQGIGSFGWPLASTFPAAWFSDDMDDCRTDISDASSEGLFIVPLKLLSADLSRTASYESCPGLDCLSQSSFALTEPSDSPASENWIVSSDCNDEEIERKVREWRC